MQKYPLVLLVTSQANFNRRFNLSSPFLLLLMKKEMFLLHIFADVCPYSVPHKQYSSSLGGGERRGVPPLYCARDNKVNTTIRLSQGLSRGEESQVWLLWANFYCNPQSPLITAEDESLVWSFQFSVFYIQILLHGRHRSLPCHHEGCVRQYYNDLIWVKLVLKLFHIIKTKCSPQLWYSRLNLWYFVELWSIISRENY